MKIKTVKKDKQYTRNKQKHKQKNDTKKNPYYKDLDVKIYYPDYEKQFTCFTREYKNIQKDRYNYKKFYKSYDSDQQIKTLVYLGINYDNKIIIQLIDLALKRFNSALLPKVYNILMSNMNDSKIYIELAKLYKSPLNKFKNLSPSVCNKNKTISEFLYNNDVIKYMPKKVVNYLDIGCGSGSFTISFGKELKLDKDHIYGVDLESFSDRGDWNRKNNEDNFIFKPLEDNKPYPFEDNFFDVITMKMVLHHIINVDFTFKEISRILKKDGVIVIIEHDAFTYADYMLCDIEHAFYINVFNENTSLEEYSKISKNKNKSKKAKTIESLDIVKYYDWIELDNLLRKYNYKYMGGLFLHDSIKFDVSATRVMYGIYKHF